MSLAKIYIHCTWSTYKRIPMLNSKEVRNNLFEHIRINAASNNIFVDTIGGYIDHCHILISLGFEQSVAYVTKMIKGESSNWINKNNLTKIKFSWQNDYFATSVSVSNLDKVRNYIKNQENHHKVKSFQEEYDEFLKMIGG